MSGTQIELLVNSRSKA